MKKSIDIVKLFQDAALQREWRFVYGARGFAEFETQSLQLAPNEEVLIMFPASVQPVIESGYWSRYRVNTQFWLMRKMEDDTESSIKETESEKYSARLRDLSFQIDDLLQKTLACHPSVQVISIRYFRELNVFSSSLDGPTSDVTFEIW